MISWKEYFVNFSTHSSSNISIYQSLRWLSLLFSQKHQLILQPPTLLPAIYLSIFNDEASAAFASILHPILGIGIIFWLIAASFSINILPPRSTETKSPFQSFRAFCILFNIHSLFFNTWLLPEPRVILSLLSTLVWGTIRLKSLKACPLLSQTEAIPPCKGRTIPSLLSRNNLSPLFLFRTNFSSICLQFWRPPIFS